MKKNVMLLCILAIGSIFCAQASMFENRQRTIEEFVCEEFKNGTSVPELESKLRKKAGSTSEGKTLAAIDAQRRVVDKDLEECLSRATAKFKVTYGGLPGGCCSKFDQQMATLNREQEIARANYCYTPEHKMQVRFWESLANRRRIKDKKREVREYVRKWGRDCFEERSLAEIKVLESRQEEVEKELKEQFLGKN